MKCWLVKQWPSLAGALLAALILVSGQWFTYWWTGSWESLGYRSSASELWSSCCRDERVGAVSVGFLDRLTDLRFLDCLAGRRFENFFCTLIVLAIGFFTGNLFTLRQRKGPAYHHAFWWAAGSVGMAWLGLVNIDYGHKVEYAAFPLFLVLLLSALRRQAIHSRAVRLERTLTESGP